jgi:hypothetical protein
MSSTLSLRQGLVAMVLATLLALAAIAAAEGAGALPAGHRALPVLLPRPAHQA